MHSLLSCRNNVIAKTVAIAIYLMASSQAFTGYSQLYILHLIIIEPMMKVVSYITECGCLPINTTLYRKSHKCTSMPV